MTYSTGKVIGYDDKEELVSLNIDGVPFIKKKELKLSLSPDPFILKFMIYLFFFKKGTKMRWNQIQIMLFGIFFISTLQAIEPTAPIYAGAYDFSDRSVRLSFMDTSENEQGFRIYHEGKIVGRVPAKEGSGQYLYIDLLDLEPSTLYRIKIVAFNTDGESDSLWKSFRTTSAINTQSNPDAPYGVGRYIGVWNISDKEVRIGFKDLSDNEQGFKVEDINGEVLLNHIPAKDTIGEFQYATLRGLEPNRLYQIYLVAYNEYGDSVPSGVRAFRTKGIPKEGGEAITREELREMIARGENVTEVNTSKITDMSDLFNVDSYSGLSIEEQNNVKYFNQNIHGWDLSHVRNMHGMFQGATHFNQPINSWNVEQVEDMSSMFKNAYDFNQRISSWNTSHVVNMHAMFNNAYSFDQDIGRWNTLSVKDMGSMFKGASSFGLLGFIPSWADPGHVGYWGIGFWKTSHVKDMSYMFAGARNFHESLSRWDTSEVVTMRGMFQGLSFFPETIGGWNTSNVEDMAFMFAGIRFAWFIDLSEWNVSKVIDHQQFFTGDGDSFKEPIWQ